MFRPAPLEASGGALRTPATSRAAPPPAPRTRARRRGSSSRRDRPLRSYSSQRRSLMRWISLWLPSTIIVAWCGHAVAGSSSANSGRGAAGGAALPSTMRGSRLRPRMFAGIGAPTRSSTVGATSTSITGSSMHLRRAPGDDDDQRHAQLLVEQILAVEVDLVLAPRLAVVGHHHDRRVVGEAELARARRSASRATMSPNAIS